jgi:ArsR family transcriptional regulator
MRVDADVEVTAGPTALMKAMAEPIRWRILELLVTEEQCVCHLVEALEVPQPLVSHHLKVLREAGLVTGERHSYWVYYRLVSNTVLALGEHLSAMALAVPTPGERRRPCC